MLSIQSIQTFVTQSPATPGPFSNGFETCRVRKMENASAHYVTLQAHPGKCLKRADNSQSDNDDFHTEHDVYEGYPDKAPEWKLLELHRDQLAPESNTSWIRGGIRYGYSDKAFHFLIPNLAHNSTMALVTAPITPVCLSLMTRPQLPGTTVQYINGCGRTGSPDNIQRMFITNRCALQIDISCEYTIALGCWS